MHRILQHPGILIPIILLLCIQSALLARELPPGRDTLKAHKLYVTAMVEMDSGRYTEARVIFEEASLRYREKKAWERAIDCDIQITNAWSASRERIGLIEFFAGTVELSEERLGVDHEVTGDCYNRLGELYYLEGEEKLAWNFLDQALGVYSSMEGTTQLKLAKVYTNYGRIKLHISQYDSVEYYLDKALDLQLGLLDSLDGRLTATYHTYGSLYYHIGKMDQSIYYRNLELKIERNKYGEFHRETADCYNNLGASYERKGDFQTAIDLHQKALDIRRSTLDSLHPYIALSCNNLGNAYASLGDYETSNNLHFEALRLRRKIFDENHRDVAMSYTNLGSNYFYTDNPERAAYYFKKVIPIMENIHGPEHMLTADAYANAGLPFYLTGRLDSAFHYLYKALVIREQIQGGVNIKVARSYNNIGAICKENRDYELSLSYYFKSMELYKKLLGDNCYPIAGSYNNIGQVYYLTDDLEKSLEYYQKSLEIEREHLGPDNPKLASSYLNLGSAMADLGRFEESFDYNQKALQLQMEAYGEKNWLVPSIYANMAVDYEELDSLDRALEFLKKAITLREEISGINDPDLAIEYTRYGMLLAKNSQTDLGLEYLYKGLSVNYFGELNLSQPGLVDPAKLKDGNLFLETLAALIDFNNNYASFGSSFELQTRNLQHYEYIADLSIELREAYRFEKSKLYALRQWDYLYSDGFETAANLYRTTGEEVYFEKAFRFAGLKKASALTDAILASQALKSSGIPDSIVQMEESLNMELEDLRQSLLEFEDGMVGSMEADSIHSQINDRVIQLNSLYHSIEKDYPEYNNMRSRYPDYLPEEITELLDPKSLLLDFVVTDSMIYALIIGKEGHGIESINIPPGFEEQVNILLRSVKKYRIEEFISQSNYIYGVLMKPLEKQFEGIEQVISIPESYLLLLPLDILVCTKPLDKNRDLSDLDYFVKRFETVSHYSTDLWVRSLQNSLKISMDERLDDFIGFAPVFDGRETTPEAETTSTVSIYSDRAVVDRLSLKQLPYTELEVGNLAGMFKECGKKAASFTRSQASEENFREISGNYRYIHIATHGLINPEKPELSGLVFWKKEKDSTDIAEPQLYITENREDGVLYTKEVYSLDLNADLVTLSACETGAGKLVKGEGLLSFVRGFIYAGVPNMLISYWSVNDKTAVDFMFDFYKGIIAGESYSTALRKAKIASISNGATAFPATWGNFMLIGH